MPTATLTSKGQTTIPKSIRDRLRLKAGDRLDFVARDDGTVLMVPATAHLADLRGMLPKPKRAATIEEMNRAIRARAAARALGRR
jgi:AbrB family looped-hinge helix DNA binding protein